MDGLLRGWVIAWVGHRVGGIAVLVGLLFSVSKAELGFGGTLCGKQESLLG